MSEVKELLQQGGFKLPDLKGVNSMSVFTLEIALESFFSTGKALSTLTGRMDADNKVENPEEDYRHNYVKNAVESIIHLHHFLELVIKDVLRTVHPSLANDIPSNPVILEKILNGKPLNSAEDQPTKTVEFSGALKRILPLIKAGVVPADYLFIEQASEWLDEINQLRNRIMHRGVYVLRHETLDELFGKYVFPFLTRLFSTPLYAGKMSSWKYTPLDCGIDPIDEMVNAFSSRSSYDTKEFILWKLLATAAYDNPIMPVSNPLAASGVTGVLNKYADSINKEKVELAKSKADELLIANRASTTDKCPVCGVDSLLVFEDNEETTTGDLILVCQGLTCTCCGFDINNNIPIASISSYLSKRYW